MKLDTIVKNLPETPGIYKMLDCEGRVIYVGKAKNIKNRVRQYFQKDYEHSTRTRKLLEHTTDIQYIQTDTELEAILLENNFIKELRPRYNILMKDDKSYVYIKVNLDEDFPRIRIVREREMNKGQSTENKEQMKSKYFGPKLATTKVYETLRVLKKLFPFRHCNLDIKLSEQSSTHSGLVGPERVLPKGRGASVRPRAKRERRTELVGETVGFPQNKNLVEVTNRVIDFPCLDYYIKRCPGPCIGAISPDEYKKIVQQVLGFLSGKTEDIEKSLKEQMTDAAGKKLFEKAARLRDKLFAIQEITERQKITDPQRIDTDVINFTAEMGRVFFNVFMIRGGKLINQENFTLDALLLTEKDMSLDSKETLEAFLTQYYEKAADIPREILLPLELENKELFEKWLESNILTPQRGEKNKLLELSLKNAQSFAKQYKIAWMAQEQKGEALSHLAHVLKDVIASGAKQSKNKSVLKRIEGFDISHLGGEETVGSMVVFENGAAKPDHFRHFKMRTVVSKPDDYRSIEEILMRRLKYLTKKEKVNMKEIRKIARAVALKKDIFIIEALKQKKEKLSFALLEKLMKSVKEKHARFYIDVEQNHAEHYLNYGFIEIKNIPDIVGQRIKTHKKTYNKKYVTLAYYKAEKKKTDPSFTAKPDLIVVDGGKGQLSTALLVLKRLNLEIPVISLAKRLEEIYLPAEKAPLLLEEGDEALKLLQRIRDESHRFAITFQRDLHRKVIYN